MTGDQKSIILNSNDSIGSEVCQACQVCQSGKANGRTRVRSKQSPHLGGGRPVGRGLQRGPGGLVCAEGRAIVRCRGPFWRARGIRTA